MKVTLVLNHACNLRCGYCYTGRKFDRPMSLEVAKRAIALGLDQVKQGWLLVAFFGGEPLLEPELLEAAVEETLARCAERKVKPYFTVSTNATLLSPKRVALLTRHKFNVQVSLDGGARSQDAMRRFANGRSSFARAAEGLQRVLAAGLTVKVVSVVDPGNVGHLSDGLEQLAGLGARAVHYSPNYLAAWSEQGRADFERALTDLGERHLQMYREGRAVHLDPLDGKIVTHLMPGASGRAACKFGVGDLAVAPSGRIYPCERLVGEDDREALCIGTAADGLDLAKIASLNPKRGEPRGECVGCELIDRCKRWCGCANFETTGDTGEVSPLVCWFEKRFIAEADRVAEALYAEENPQFLKRFYGRGASDRTA
jgi:uncharacterized protein